MQLPRLGDDESARHLQDEVETRRPLSKDVLDRLAPEWKDVRRALRNVDPEGELADVLAGVRERDPSKADAMEAAIRRARERRDDGPPPLRLVGAEVSGLPVIVCGSDDPTEGLKTWTPAALAALAARNSPPTVFRRGNILCRVKPADPDAPAAIEPMTEDALRGVLDRSASFATLSMTKDGPRPKFGPPKMEIVRDILALGDWPADVIPPLDGIATSPRFLPDGRLLTTPGYDRESRLIYDPPAELLVLEVPDRPTARELREALSLIFDHLLYDFPFANRGSKANALAIMLLPFVRHLIDGPTPLHHFSAATEGTGKGLCAAACAWPSLGGEPTLRVQKENEAEWRKSITSALMAGGSHFFIDNMYNPRGWDDCPLPVDSGTLAGALTAPYWEDRLLGGNKTVRIKITVVFMSTGNNVVFSRELTRRIVLVELMTPVETPSLRTGFKHDPLIEAFARPRRRDLVVACLTIIQHWLAEGRPAGSCTMGSYESYARVMGGILDAAEVPGFLSNRPKGPGKDPETLRWSALVARWRDIHTTANVTARELRHLISSDEDLRISFSDVLGDGKEDSQAKKLGKSLAAHDGRVYGEWRITQSSVKARSGVSQYRLQPASEPVGEIEVEDE